MTDSYRYNSAKRVSHKPHITVYSYHLRTFRWCLEVFLGDDLLGAAVLGVHQAGGRPTAADAVATDEGTKAEERSAGEEHAKQDAKKNHTRNS